MRNYFNSLVLLSLFTGFAHADVLSFGILGDAGHWNSAAEHIQNSMRRSKIDSLILPGDNLYDPELGYEQVWRHWRTFNLDIVAIGNHYLTYESEIAYFQMPGEFYARRVHPEVLFLVLNSDNDKTYKVQTEWLENQLKVAEEKIVFVVYHHPPYTISERHSWKEKMSFQIRAKKILQKYSHKIDALIVGHDHIASLIKVGDIPMIVSGASFEAIPTHPIDYVASDGVHVKSYWLFDDGPHWTRLDIDTEKEIIWMNFVQATHNHVVCSALIKHSGVWLKESCLKNQKPIKDPRKKASLLLKPHEQH